MTNKKISIALRIMIRKLIEQINIVGRCTAHLTVIPNFSQNLRSPNTEALQEVGLNRAIADFPNQQSVVRF